MASARIRRGRQTQEIFAAWLREHTFRTRARAVPASVPGKDILDTPGLSIEVKATRENDLLHALRQAEANAVVQVGGGRVRDLPLVVWRPDGYGPAQIEDWVVAFRLKDADRVMKEASFW